MSKYNSPPQRETKENIRAIAERWMKDVWQDRIVDAVDELHSPQFVDHSPAGRATDNEGYKKGLEELFRAFPDFVAETEDLIIDAHAGKVAIRWTATGTHRETFLGIPPTDRQVTFRGIEIVRIENGHIVERWGEWDGTDLTKQLTSAG